MYLRSEKERFNIIDLTASEYGPVVDTSHGGTH